MRRASLYATTLLVVLLIWQLQAMRIGKPDFFPFPIDVAGTLVELLTQVGTYETILHSFGRLVISIAAATGVGVVIGIVAGFNDTFATLMRPIVTSLRTLPVASLIVIILIIYGHARSLYVITFLMIFPIVFEASKQGVLNVETSIRRALAMEAVQPYKKLFMVHLPLAFPYIKTGFLQSIGLGFKVLVMAEFIAQSPISIGNALYRGRINFQYDHVFAWTIILIVLVTLVEAGINQLRSEPH